MTDDKNQTGKVTLDVEDLLNLVSKPEGTAPISGISQEHVVEAEELKKAWFKHVLLNVENLDKKIDEGLKEVKDDFQQKISKLEKRLEKGEDSLAAYKKDIIEPMKEKVITITVKMGMWAAVGGIGGSILLLLFKHAFLEGGP